MKSGIFFFSFILCFSTLYAQHNFINTRVTKYGKPVSVFHSDSLEIGSSGSDNYRQLDTAYQSLLTGITLQSVNDSSGDWYYTDSTAYYYNSDSQDTLELGYKFVLDSNEWVSKSKLSLSYNEQGLLAHSLKSIWNQQDSNWTIDTKDDYSYDLEGNKVGSYHATAHVTPDSTYWIPVWQFTYEYNADNLETMVTQDRWDTINNHWYGVFQTGLSYDDNLDNDSIFYYFLTPDSSAWIKGDLVVCHYDNAHHILDSFETDYYYGYYLNPDDVSTYFSAEHDYDENWNETSYISNDWDYQDSSFFRMIHDVFTFNNYNQKTSWTSYTWAYNPSGDSIPGFRELYTYDEYGNLLNPEYQTYNSTTGQFVGDQLFHYYYNTTMVSSGMPQVNDVNRLQVYPNPVSNGIINVSFMLMEPEYLTFQLYDSSGKLVRNGMQRFSSGKNFFQFDAHNLSKGIYELRAENKGKHLFSSLKLLIQ